MDSTKLNVLFVCSRNQWRTPTAEKIYEDDARVNVRSRGTTRNAVQKLTSNDLNWADVVFAMENKHKSRILADFPGEAKFKIIYVLDIPDDYRYMELDLINLIWSAAEPIIESMQV